MRKRSLDLVLASLAVLLLLPLLVVIAIAVCIDARGSVVYRAARVGRGGRLFKMFKFYTMNGRGHSNPPRVTAADDPRITRLGKFLRITKLNELPQLFNVIKGDMSLVGPRPEDPEFVRHYSVLEAEVLSIRPGITSPASIIYYDEERLLSFANATDSYIKEIMPRKLRLDLQYVRYHSLLLDFDVLFQTFISLIPKFRSAVPELDEMLFGPIQRFCKKYIPWFVIDWIVGFMAIGLAGVIWRQRMPLNIGVEAGFAAALFLASMFSLVNWATGMHRIEWRRASNSDAMGIAFSATVATGLLLIANKWALGRQIFPSGMVVLGCFFALNGFIASRYWRVVLGGLSNSGSWENGGDDNRANVIIVGAGEMAAFAARSLVCDSRAKGYRLIGFVDDDPVKRGARIRGIKVIGPTRRIAQLVKDFKVAVILVAMEDFDPDAHPEILQACRQSGARVVLVPDILSSLYSGMSVEMHRRAG